MSVQAPIHVLVLHVGSIAENGTGTVSDLSGISAH
jgi:hypothetical protein